MPITNNEIDMRLLSEDVPALIDKYQYKVALIVRSAIKRGFFQKMDEQDIVQSINERLWRKSPKIQQQYKNNASVSTYLSVIIQNICKELYRKERRKILSTSLQESGVEISAMPAHPQSVHDSFNQLTIAEELKKLDLILQTYGKQQAKVLLFLKLMCRIPLKETDILNFYSECPEIYLIKYMYLFGAAYQRKTDKEIYQQIQLLIHLADNKKTSTEAIKKWIEYKIQQIIEVLNNTSQNANYDKECLKILVTCYFNKK